MSSLLYVQFWINQNLIHESNMQREIRDIQILPTTPFSLLLHARNILTVHRETLTQYIAFKRVGRGGVCTLVQCSLACNCDVRLGADSDKIPEGVTSTFILYLSGRDEQSFSSISRLRTRTSNTYLYQCIQSFFY
jgi:hypothetical protein